MRHRYMSQQLVSGPLIQLVQVSMDGSGMIQPLLELQGVGRTGPPLCPELAQPWGVR